MKINIRKKTLSAILSSFILITNNTYAELSTKNDYIMANSDVNMRLDKSIDRQKIGLFDIYNFAYRFLSIDDWDLIRYNDTIGFVKSEYVNSLNVIDENSITYTEIHDILYTTSNVNLRLSPEISANKISTIKNGSELITIAMSNNNWYIVKYNGRIGFVNGEFVKSLKTQVKEEYNIDIDVQKIAFSNDDNYLFNNDGFVSGLINKYETAYILYEGKDYSLIKTNKYIGYINNSSITTIDKKFIDIDLEEQEIKLYDQIDVLINADIVSGKTKTPTRIGNFKIYSKLKGEDYNSYVNFWMPFDGGIGLHDAQWRKKFGGNIYINNGSHGCVNLPYDVAEYIYSNVSVGTKVLVHK